MDQFQPGDRVRLRSGGPLMTVVSAPRGDVKCFWFGSGDELHEQNFPAVTLVLVEPAARSAATDADGSMGKILAKSLEKQHQAAQQKLRRKTKQVP